ncbi:MAG: hypothetical protein IPM42_06295 [Saprospiraceae bacterium]|nr:hypothetical protein [Saprospiraceae bacterium]
MSLKFYFTSALLIFLGNILMAQSPVSGFMTPKGKTTLSFSTTTEKYDEVFLVPVEITGVPIFNNVKIRSYSFYGTYGLSDKLNLVLNLPFIQSTGNAGAQVLENLNYENERSGIQDVSVYAKYKAHESMFGSSTLSLVGALGLQTPLGGYKVDEGLQSILAIGNRATQLNAIAIAFFKTNSGAFASGQAGYSLRSDVVPDAVMTEIKLGYAGKYFYIDGFLANQMSTSGVDILGAGFTGDFTATRVSYTRVGGSVYVPFSKHAGISFGLSQYIKGRNVAKSSGLSFGIAAAF